MTLQQAKDKISKTLQKLASASGNDAESAITKDLKSGKFYEAWVLANLIEKLGNEENFTFVLVNSNQIELKSGRGPINRKFPYISVFDNMGSAIGEIWTDVEFMGYSAVSRKIKTPQYASDKHELDILLCKTNSNPYPYPTDIYLGVECKRTPKATKQMLKSMLGIRRELSYKMGTRNTFFKKWPRTNSTMKPPVCLLFYSRDSKLSHDWKSAEDFFEIDFKYLPF